MGLPSTRNAARVVGAATYVVLVAALVLSRLTHLGKSFWEDEIYFVAGYVREGLGEILIGPGLSHQLYGVLTWATAEVVGESELAFRLWSAVPFVVGVLVVTAWLRARLNATAGLLYLFLATVSPLLLDLSRQARGYGLAFLAMSVMVVAALEADRTGRTRAVAVMSVAGVLGTWTLPQLGIAFLAAGVVLLADRRTRKATAVGLLSSVVAIVAWYAPHLSQIHSSSQVDNGVQISTGWLITAPIDQILLPGLLWIEGRVPLPGAVWLPLVLVAVLVISSSPYVHDRSAGLILCSGPAVTMAVLWAVDAYIWPRYLSYLLVPSFVLLSSGASALLERLRTRPALLRTALCLVAIALLAANFASVAPDVVQLPRQANRDAARLIETRSPSSTPVFAYLTAPSNLAFYLSRPVRSLDGTDVAARVCGEAVPVVYVMEPFGVEPVDVPCLRRAGVEHFRFREYAAGGVMNVWFVPPRG